MIDDYYIATHNSDLTEGRGTLVESTKHAELDTAVEEAQTNGVMGTPGGVRHIWFGEDDEGFLVRKHEDIWGYRRDWSGKWGHGFMDNRDAPTSDPEYIEYLRLKAKFEK